MHFHRKRKISSLDIILLCIITGSGLFITYRLFYTLDYKWDWAIIFDYLIGVDENGKLVPKVLLQGLFVTIKLSVWGILLAIGLGIIMGIMRTSRRLFYKMISRTYVELIRNIPPLVLVFIFYFFVSDQLMPLLGIQDYFRSLPEENHFLWHLVLTDPPLIPQFLSGVITIGVFQGAYITEIVRGGIQALPQGQWEASSALGLSRWQQMRLIILPQAIRIMLPPLANEFINTIKYSSIVSVISIQELTFQGMQVMASTQVTIEVWLTITVMYLMLCLLLSIAAHRLEKRFAPTSA